jgi:lipopolysaccharide transport system ATP-binding protein
MPHILADRLTIEFPLYHIGARSLKKRVMAASRLREDDSNRIVVAALRDLSFAIAPGERVALVGNNGAGKTTLLRTLAGVYEPVGGRLEVAGSIGSLIDPAAGMDAESTGRENIVLRGLFRGMSEAECLAMAEEVGAFSGLGEFLDVPVRTYSAGMSVRLAFAVATLMEPEILLMDEWFLAGDADFMQRARTRLEQLVRKAEILVLATHDVNIVREWCTRAIRLEGGRVVMDGTIEAVLGMLPGGEPAYHGLAAPPESGAG